MTEPLASRTSGHLLVEFSESYAEVAGRRPMDVVAVWVQVRRPRECCPWLEIFLIDQKVTRREAPFKGWIACHFRRPRLSMKSSGLNNLKHFQVPELEQHSPRTTVANRATMTDECDNHAVEVYISYFIAGAAETRVFPSYPDGSQAKRCL